MQICAISLSFSPLPPSFSFLHLLSLKLFINDNKICKLQKNSSLQPSPRNRTLDLQIYSRLPSIEKFQESFSFSPFRSFEGKKDIKYLDRNFPYNFFFSSCVYIFIYLLKSVGIIYMNFFRSRCLFLYFLKIFFLLEISTLLTILHTFETHFETLD